MANKRIKDLVEKSTLVSGDYFPVDNSNGTKKVDAEKITVPLGNISDANDEYSSSKAYKVGDMVIHDNVLYECTTACSAATWQTNQGYFTATTLANAVTTLNASLTDDVTFDTNHVDLSPYTTDTYKVPADGYVYVDAQNSTGGIAIVLYGDSAKTNIVGGPALNAQAYDRISTFVRKGTYLRITKTTNGIAIYTPII